MDMSFSVFRDKYDDPSSDSETEIIEDSDENSKNFTIKRNGKLKEQVVIPDSESSSDDEKDSSWKLLDSAPKSSMVISDSDTDNESEDELPIKYKKNHVRKIESDSESDSNIGVEDSTRSNKDEDVAFSAVTRMSIFGVKPSDCASDESDFIQSDDEDNTSLSSEISLSEMGPNPYINESLSSTKLNGNVLENNENNTEVINLDACNMSLTEEPVEDKNNMSLVYVISDEEDVVMTPKITRTKSLTEKSFIQPTIKTYLKNQSNIYVTKQVRQNEIKKLEELREDLMKVKKLLQKMNVDVLPDKGFKLNKRLSEIETEYRVQAEKVANMIVEPNKPSSEDIKKDNFINWDDLEKGSNAVKPKMFGSQAMNTHITQKTLTLERLHDLHASLATCPAENATIKPPNNIVTPLMPHQLYALSWLIWRETEKPRGGILADDMGLGKTLTMISLILYNIENNIVDENDENDEDDSWNKKKSGKKVTGGTLVVCPASLLNQWYNEITTHSKKYSLKYTIHHGPKREVKALKLARNDVVITTYNIVQRDLEKKGVLMNIKWQRIILDEAHIVRNHKSLTAEAVFNLASNTRWCLTGTPVHNKDLDLFSLLKFLRCSPFDDIVLWKKWIDNKSTGGQERLAMIIKAIMLRRTKQQLQEKKELKELPQKKYVYIDVKLTKDEMNVYQKVLVLSKTLFAQFLHQRAEKLNRIEPSQEAYYKMHKKMVSLHGTKEVKSHEILVLLLRLRQICCHPGLIRNMLNDEQEFEEDSSFIQQKSEVDMLSEISKLNIDDVEEDVNDTNKDEGIKADSAIKQIMNISNPIFDLNNKSAKIDAVVHCLQENILHTRDKAIVVSQWTGVLNIIKKNLSYSKINCSMLSGQVSIKDRQHIVSDFNNPSSDIQILLLSLCAGGVGLNLVGGNHLLLVDLHWNPQLEAQAQDRIYRMGQTKNVYIYKFVCQDTVESRIKVLQDKKLELANNVLMGAKIIHSSKLSIDELKMMLNMQ